jgi:transposase InsO family protein
LSRCIAQRSQLLACGECLSKKVASLSSLKTETGAREKAQIIDELRQQYPITDILKIAGLARSIFYYQKQRLKAEDKYASLKQKIDNIYKKHHGHYRYRRVTEVIRQLGETINHKTVQRLMKRLNLKSLARPKKYRSYKGDVGHTAPNILKRDFKAQELNKKWVTDVTEFHVASEKLYLSPIMDLFNGEIIAFSMSKRPVYKMIDDMLKQAFKRLRPSDQPILHSDQGWQYRMSAYQTTLQSKQLVQSMSRKGNCLDNAAMVSFFSVLKTEFFYLNKFTNVEQLTQGIKDYIHYYNHDRIK